MTMLAMIFLEREEIKRRKEEKGDKEKRRQQTAPHYGPNVALHEELDRFCFLRTILLLRRGFFFDFALASVTKCIQNAF
jgi:hypothetical protein